MKTRVLSLLIALAILVTVGGVYATWLYAQSDMTAVHGHIGSFGLASATINNNQGTFTVDATNAHLIIDQKDTSDYTAVLKAEGTITVKFTPSDIFKNTNKDKETFAVTYSLLTDNTNPTGYKVPDGTGADKELFTKFDTTTKTDLTLHRGNDGNYTATVQATELLKLMAINSFTLDSYAKYTAFSAKAGVFGNIGFQVDDVNPAPAA